MATTLAPSIGPADAPPRPFHWTAEAYRRAWDAGVFGHAAKLELVSGRVIEQSSQPTPREYRWAADDYDRACDMGVFGPEARLELIHGRIIDRMGQGPLHLSCRVRVGRRLRTALEPRLFVVDECPIRIAFDGEPVADIAVLGGSDGDYDEQNPTPEDVTLLVEVAVSSKEFDLDEKALLYSQAGIADYWVVLPGENAVVVHRDPTANGYGRITRLGADDTIFPLAVSEVSLPVRTLLGR